MKTLNKLGLLFLMSFLMVSCGDGNVLDKVNPFSSSSQGINPGNVYQGGIEIGGAGVQQIASVVPCVTTTGFGSQNRVAYGPFVITGGDGSGYTGAMIQGQNPTGNSTGVYVGVSGSPTPGTGNSGDLIEVISYDNGTARVMLYLCEEQPLVYNGRPLIAFSGLQGSKLTIAPTTNCGTITTGQVTSFQAEVVLGNAQYNGINLGQAAFRVSFSTYKFFAPQLCNNGYY